MDESQVERCYTLLGVRLDGEIPTVDVISAATDAEALGRATAWLDARQTCRLVEVWRGGAMVGVLHGPGGDDAMTEADQGPLF